MKNILKYTLTFLIICPLFFSCEEELNVQPVDEFSEGNALQSREGIEAVLFSSYGFDIVQPGAQKNEILINEVTTDIGFVRIGAVEREMKPFINFNWDASMDPFINQFWLPRYRAVRDANIVLENINRVDLDEDYKNRLIAEARYLRAAQYAVLYRYFGVVPLRTTTDLTVQPQALPLPTEEEFFTFVETELREAANDLLHPSEQVNKARATKGHAYAVLTKFLLQTKQWSKVVEVTDLLMDLNYYELFPEYRATFFVENEGNKEVIVPYSYRNERGFGSLFQNGSFPPRFLRAANVPEFTWTDAMGNWPTQFSIKDDFYDSFDPADDRRQAIIEEYENKNGVIVNLRTTPDNLRSLKYFDSNQTGNFSGSDLPYIRYADILLSRAEALNEINGPTDVSVGLVNDVRTRSIDDEYTLAEVGDKDSFRDIILQERGWEFYSEGKRREDLVRHGKLLEYAENRGLNPQPHQVSFPYPLVEVQANPALDQKDGY
jgi:hypothetical protein